MIKFKAILFTFLLVSVNFLFAQKIERKTINLNWVQDSKININEKQTIKTDIVEGYFLDENLNPQFSKSWKIDTNSEVDNYSIENIVFEPVNNNSKKINTSILSSEVKADLNLVYAKNTPYLTLTITPLIYSKKSVKRIASFDLNYSLKSKTSFSRKIASSQNSVLSEDLWYKFAIDTTGVYKIDKTFLEDLGINMSNVNPENIRLYGNGGGMLPVSNSDPRFEGLQENAIIVAGEGDSKFDNEDYMLFYGQGPHKWIYKNKTSLPEVKHVLNIYSDQAYYFINISNTKGKEFRNV